MTYKRKKQEHEIIPSELINKVVYEWTNVDISDQSKRQDIINRTPKGKHWAQTLAEKSTNHMRNISHMMTTSALHGTLVDMRVIEILRAGFSDILLEVYEQRKKTESMESV